MDKQQQVFEDFAVPDPIRIAKSIELIRSDFPNIEGLRILECGITRGGVADILGKEGAVCIGLDIHERSVPGIKTVQADLNDGLPKFDHPFDVVFAGEIIEHIFDDAGFLRQIYATLKPGGIFVMTTPNLVSGFNRLYMLFGGMPLFAYAPYHYHIYNKRVLKNMLQDAGFEIEKTRSSHLLYSRRRHFSGRIFEILGDWFPSLGAHLIIAARKP